MIYQMRKLKPPPKVIPPKPPAYLFEPEEAAKPSNGLDFAEARVPVQKSASLYDGKHDKFAGDNLYRDIVNDPEINFEEDVRRQMELLEKDIKKMVGGASSSSSAIANEPNGDLGKRSRRAAAEYSVPIDDIHSDRNRNSYYDEAPIDRRQYQQELPESVDSVGYAKKLEPDKGPPHRVGGGLAHMYEEDSYRNLVNEKKANYARLLQEQIHEKDSNRMAEKLHRADRDSYHQPAEPSLPPRAGGLAHMYDDDRHIIQANAKKSNYARLLQEQMQEQQSQRRHESQAYKEAPREQPAYFRPDYENQYASNVKVRDGGYHGSPPKSNYAIPSDALLHDLYGGPSAGVSRVYEGKQRQRRIELAEEGGGMVFGMDKKSEAAQKRAKQEEYKRQLDQMQKKDINIPGKKHSPARSRARIADPFSNEPSLSNYRDMGYPSEYAYAQALGLMNDKRASDLYDDRGLYERQPIRNSPERVRPAPVLHTEFAIGENKNSVKKRELQDAYRRELDQQMLERKDINKQLSPQRDIPKRRDYEDQYDRYPQSRIDSAYEEPYNPYSLAKPTDNAARGGYRPHLREDPYQTDYPREYDNVGYDVNPYADAARQEDYRISPPKLNKPVHDVYRESPTKYDGWRPSGNVSDDRAKRAAAMQKAALDEQIRMDKARKEEEKEREAKRLRDEDARIQADLQAMRDEAERERQQKLASARESAQKYDEMQNKQLMEALARKGKRHTLMEKESADGYNQHGEAVNLDAQVSENPYEVYEEKAELEYDSPNKTPTKARTRLINDMYSVGNKMLAHNEIGSSIDGKWRPSGNYSDDKKKTAAAQQKAALDEQLKQDKLRKEKLKEEEKRKEEKEEARILADLNAMNEEAEREKRLKQALADEQARSMIEMQDKKMKEALARKGKVESAAKREKPRSPPLAIDVQHDQPRSIYDHISSPLQQMINQKQNEAPQSHHSNQVEHNYRPIARPDAVDSLMRSYQSNPGYPPNFHPNHMQYPYYPQQQHLYMPYQYPPENGMIYGAPSPYMQPPQYYPVYVAPPVRVNDQNNQIHQMGLQKIDENDVSFVSESRLLPAHPLASDIFASMGVGNSIESNNSRASGGRNDDSFYSQQSINSYPKKAKAEPSVDGSYEGGMRSSESIMEQSLTSNSLLMYLGNRTPVDPNLIIPQKEYKIEKEIVSDEKYMTRTPPRSASSARNVGIAASQNSPLSKLIADTNSMIEKEIEATKKEEEKLGREVPSRPKSGKVLHSQRSASEIEKETARDIAQIRLASPKATVERVLSPQNESNYVPKNRIFMKMPEKVSQAKVQEESHKEIMEPVQLKIPLTSNRGDGFEDDSMDNLTSSRKVSRPSSGRPSSSRPTSSSQVVSSIRRPTPDQTPPRMTSSGGRNRTDPFAEEEHTDEDELHIIPNTSGDFYHKKYQDVQAEQHSARVARIGDLSARLEEEAKPLSARKQDYGQVLKPRGKPIDTSSPRNISRGERSAPSSRDSQRPKSVLLSEDTGKQHELAVEQHAMRSARLGDVSNLTVDEQTTALQRGYGEALQPRNRQSPQPNNVVDGQNSIPSSSSGERTGSRNAKKWDKSSDARNATIELLAERGNGTKDAVVAETAVEDEDSYDDDYDEESLG